MNDENEKIWTDDSIRWLDAKKDQDSNEQEVEECFDIFNDGVATFHFKFNHPIEEDKEIQIQLDGYKYDSHETYQSTGLTIWLAAEHLCAYLIQHHDILHGKRILELGAGLGLCGILVHNIASKSNICITDGDTGALKKLRENVAKNSKCLSSCDVSCRQLLWGKETSQVFLDTFSEGVQYDLIIASDILYSPVVVEPLWQSIQVLLHQGGTFLMAFAKRKVPVTIESFLQAASLAGFSYKCVRDEVVGKLDFNTPKEHVWIYSFEWKTEEEARESSL
jgi:predicted nicotinamide N-methyase